MLNLYIDGIRALLGFKTKFLTIFQVTEPDQFEQVGLPFDQWCFFRRNRKMNTQQGIGGGIAEYNMAAFIQHQITILDLFENIAVNVLELMDLDRLVES